MVEININIMISNKVNIKISIKINIRVKIKVSIGITSIMLLSQFMCIIKPCVITLIWLFERRENNLHKNLKVRKFLVLLSE